MFAYLCIRPARVAPFFITILGKSKLQSTLLTQLFTRILHLTDEISCIMKFPSVSHRLLTGVPARLFVIALFLLFCNACEEQIEDSPAVKYLYAGHQENNGFQLWIWIYEDEAVPALVRSGRCRYLFNQFVETDEEHLTCRMTQDGFTLSEPTTGKVLYTATNIEIPYTNFGYAVHITWAHSPGATWDASAEEKGWQREMDLSLQINEGDDIVY